MRKPLWRPVTAIVLAIMVAGLWGSQAQAHHYTVTKADYRWNPGYGDPYNGNKVFLASPRHTDSGNRGECGTEENINGRYHNTAAGSGSYYKGVQSTNRNRDLLGRGYKVMIGRNTRSGRYQYQNGGNLKLSRNYGSDIHIVTHSNAASGRCQSARYWLVMWNNTNAPSVKLARQLHRSYSAGDGAHPVDHNMGDETVYFGGRTAELGATFTTPAYIELGFHTNQNDSNWMAFGAGAYRNAWRMGRGVDFYLEFP